MRVVRPSEIASQQFSQFILNRHSFFLGNNTKVACDSASIYRTQLEDQCDCSIDILDFRSENEHLLRPTIDCTRIDEVATILKSPLVTMTEDYWSLRSGDF